MSELDRDLKNEQYYPCTCHREANVREMGAIRADETFHLSWNCPCRLDFYERAFIVHQGALRRLLAGLRPVLPYSAAERMAIPLKPVQESQLRVFRWECEQLEGVEEFLLFASRPAPRALPQAPE